MRYFIVHYRGMYSSRSADESVFINDDKGIRSKTYPNKRTTIEELKEEFGLKYVGITSIEEVTKEQFEHYYM